MNAIFLSKYPEKLEAVYSPRLRETICGEADCDSRFWKKEDILADPPSFRQVKWIFSTWGMPAFTEEEIRAFLPSLEAVFYAAGSVQSFARPFLRCGVKVFSAWMANAVPVAEYTVAQILLANKGFFTAARQMRVGEVAGARTTAKKYPGNFDATVGIIGTGAIGRLVCKALKQYRIRVLACSLELDDALAEELGVEISDMDTIFKSCHVISNHLANNEQTKGIYKYEHFSSMRPCATFLNTGRGAQVVESDLIAVLRQRPDLTAVLDVTDPEPPEVGSPFYELPNCVLTPHIAGSSGQEVQRMAEWIWEEYLRHRESVPCRYEVTEKMLEVMA